MSSVYPSDDWLDGHNAFSLGLLLGDCPHAAGTEAAGHWERGWLMAQQEAAFRAGDIEARPSTAVRAAGHLQAAAETMLERDGKYRGSDSLYAEVMHTLFPDGIRLVTQHDQHRFHIFMLAMVKLTRYVRNWSDGHADSLTDLINYVAMLQALDQVKEVADHDGVQG